MKEQKIKYSFHAGCDECLNTIEICPGCRYMEPNWDLPDLNEGFKKEEEKAFIKEEEERLDMVKLAKNLHKKLKQ